MKKQKKNKKTNINYFLNTYSFQFILLYKILFEKSSHFLFPPPSRNHSDKLIFFIHKNWITTN